VTIEANEACRSIARRLGRDPETLDVVDSQVPCAPAEQTLFLDPAVPLKWLLARLGPQEDAWARLRRDVQRSAEVRLRASAGRIAGDLKEQIEHATRFLA
jgi:hypothetical protein